MLIVQLRTILRRLVSLLHRGKDSLVFDEILWERPRNEAWLLQGSSSGKLSATAAKCQRFFWQTAQAHWVRRLLLPRRKGYPLWARAKLRTGAPVLLLCSTLNEWFQVQSSIQRLWKQPRWPTLGPAFSSGREPKSLPQNRSPRPDRGKKHPRIRLPHTWSRSKREVWSNHRSSRRCHSDPACAAISSDLMTRKGIDDSKMRASS